MSKFNYLPLLEIDKYRHELIFLEHKATSLSYNQNIIENSDVSETLVKVIYFLLLNHDGISEISF
jgi:hypothetical protein